ncbi:cyclase/dehydrase [Bacillus freudenreichii]|nr:cyclase/dehydrase [Bacillus freudenreichii]
MKIYHMNNSLIVNAPIEEVWGFFSNPGNLAVLTPPKLKFQFMQEPPSRMFPGQGITYRLSPLPGFRTRWEGEITEVIEIERFIDEQRKGPFAYWRHEHLFYEKAIGTEVRDHLKYALPLGMIGAAFRPFIQRKMMEMFTYRNEKLKELFS